MRKRAFARRLVRGHIGGVQTILFFGVYMTFRDFARREQKMTSLHTQDYESVFRRRAHPSIARGDYVSCVGSEGSTYLWCHRAMVRPCYLDHHLSYGRHHLFLIHINSILYSVAHSPSVRSWRRLIDIGLIACLWHHLSFGHSPIDRYHHHTSPTAVTETPKRNNNSDHAIYSTKFSRRTLLCEDNFDPSIPRCGSG